MRLAVGTEPGASGRPAAARERRCTQGLRGTAAGPCVPCTAALGCAGCGGVRRCAVARRASCARHARVPGESAAAGAGRRTLRCRQTGGDDLPWCAAGRAQPLDGWKVGAVRSPYHRADLGAGTEGMVDHADHPLLESALLPHLSRSTWPAGRLHAGAAGGDACAGHTDRLSRRTTRCAGLPAQEKWFSPRQRARCHTGVRGA